MLVFEGCDNSGKTTLARSLNLPYHSAGPAPKDMKELVTCVREQIARTSTPCCQDRLTAISQQVYGENLQPHVVKMLKDELAMLIDTARVIVVYCRPPERVLMDLSTHKLKSYDTEEMLQKIVDHQHEYVQRYDEIMKDTPHFLFDWTDCDDKQTEFVRKKLEKSQESDHEWGQLRAELSWSKVGRVYG